MAENDISFSKWPDLTLTRYDTILILDYELLEIIIEF